MRCFKWQSITKFLLQWHKRNVHWTKGHPDPQVTFFSCSLAHHMHVNGWNQRIWKWICFPHLHWHLTCNHAGNGCKSLFKIFGFIHWQARGVQGCSWRVWLVDQEVLCFSAHFSCVIEAKNWLLTVIWSNALKKYYIQIWYIFMRRILFGDLLKFYKFLFWLSV